MYQLYNGRDNVNINIDFRSQNFCLLYGNINKEYKLTLTENRITRKYLLLYDLYKGTFFLMRIISLL